MTSKSGDDTLDGTSSDDTLVGGSGDDTLNGGEGDDKLIGGSGDDTGDGGDGSDFLQGGSGNDTLFGGAGDDTIEGSSGNDIIDGGSGSDTAFGGSGDDTFVYVASENTDSTDFYDAGDGTSDTLRLVLTEDEAAAASGDIAAYQEFLENPTSMSFQFTAFDLEVANFEHLVVVTLAAEGGQIIQGSSGDDTLSGSAEDDVLTGGAGNDTLDGGDGVNDTVDYGAEDGGGGVIVDLAAGTATDSFGDTDTLIGIESVVGTSSADSIAGSDADNTLDGGEGNDTLSGGAGNDTLIGGGGDDAVDGGTGNDRIVGGSGHGDDTYIGGDGTDTVEYPSTTLGVAVNLSAVQISATVNGSLVTVDPGTAVGPEIGTDTLISIENIVGGSGDDTIVGDANDNVFEGGAGDDIVQGAAGTDVLISGAGDDTYSGGSDEITVFGVFIENGFNDTIDYRNDPSQNNDGVTGVTVDLAAGTATDGWGDTDTLSGLEIVRGSAFDDSLTGGANDTFELFQGNAGDDAIDGGSGSDVADYQFDPAGVIANLSSVSVTETLPDSGTTHTVAAGQARDGWGDTDSFTSIENLYGSAHSDILIGDDGDNRLRGREGDDELRGGDGNDEIDYLLSPNGVVVNLSSTQRTVDRDGDSVAETVIDGLTALDGEAVEGTDTLQSIEEIRGSFFDDIFIGSDLGHFESFVGLRGDDLIDGGGGTFDQVNYASGSFLGGTQGVVVDLAAETATDPFGDTDTLLNIERVIGSAFDDQITGDNQNNFLFGFDGDDMLDGGAGNDTLNGAAGTDIIWGNDGSDNLTGGGGVDFFNFDDGDGGATISDADVIMDFLAGTDVFGYTGDPSTDLNFDSSLDVSGGGANDTVVSVIGTGEVLAVVQDVSITDADAQQVAPLV